MFEAATGHSYGAGVDSHLKQDAACSIRATFKREMVTFMSAEDT